MHNSIMGPFKTFYRNFINILWNTFNAMLVKNLNFCNLDPHWHLLLWTSITAKRSNCSKIKFNLLIWKLTGDCTLNVRHSCMIGQPSSARWQYWFQMNDISFSFEILYAFENRSFSSGICTGTWRWRLPILLNFYKPIMYPLIISFNHAKDFRFTCDWPSWKINTTLLYLLDV